MTLRDTAFLDPSVRCGLRSNHIFCPHVLHATDIHLPTTSPVLVDPISCDDRRRMFERYAIRYSAHHHFVHLHHTLQSQASASTHRYASNSSSKYPTTDPLFLRRFQITTHDQGGGWTLTLTLDIQLSICSFPGPISCIFGIHRARAVSPLSLRNKFGGRACHFEKY